MIKIKMIHRFYQYIVSLFISATDQVSELASASVW